MAVRKSSSMTLDVPSSVVAPWVTDLARYPTWMSLVHSAISVPDGANATAGSLGDADTWDVELRAKVGVLARSKRLRMHRTTCTPTQVVFERREQDGRVHAPWILEVLLEDRGGGCTVTMNLEYAGSLWTAGVLDRVLAHHIEAGKEGLARVVHGA